MGTCTLPHSVIPSELERFTQEVYGMMRAIAGSVKQATNVDQINSVKAAFLNTRNYYRWLRMIDAMGHLGTGQGLFDDHDQVASTILYVVNKFDRLTLANKGMSTETVLPKTIREWAFGAADAARVFNPPRFGPAAALDTRVYCGILTVLEHEYQSVLRRLDSISAMTDDTSSGFAILDRPSPTHDLKNIVGRPIGDRAIGWVDGQVGGRRILVVCTGRAGSDASIEAIGQVNAMQGIPDVGWLVVGVCAGTNKRWPIGTVLTSNGEVFGVESEHAEWVSSKLQIVKAETRVIGAPSDGTTELSSTFRIPPAPIGKAVGVARPDSIEVHSVPFASARRQVVNSTSARRALVDHLRNKQWLGARGHLGIEMEAGTISRYSVKGLFRTICGW